MAQHQPTTGRAHWSFALLALLFLSSTAWGQTSGSQRIFSPSQRAVNKGAFQLASINRAMSLDVNIAAFKGAAAPEMTITSVPLAPGLTVDLELKEWKIIEPGAHLVFGTENGERPITVGTRMYRGKVKGERESDVFLSFADGSILGHVRTYDKSYEISTDFDAKRDNDLLPAVSYPTDALPNAMVNCGVTEENLRDLLGGNWVDYDYEKYSALRQSEVRTAAGVEYAIPGAWEGDAEYRQLFSSDQEAADYMVQLIGEVSAIYERDLQTQLTISHMKIWTSSSAAGYPYTEASVMSVALRQVRDYWNLPDNKKIPHAISHTMSGKAWTNPIGIAFLDVLCPELLNNRTEPQGSYSAITRTNSARDRRVVAHEVGHNVGANHTHHCGWPIPGGPGPIDKCAPAEGGSCFSATEQQVGTIMSYCSQTELKFHPLVIDKLKTQIVNAPCLIAAKKLLVEPALVIFANEVQGVPRDSVLEAFFTNTGQFEAIEVTDVARSGENNDQFEILEGMPPFTLQPNETKTIKVRFKAGITEGAEMHLLYSHNGLNPPVDVVFEGYASDIRPILALQNDFEHIDWGVRFSGSVNDTLQDGLYLNLGVDGINPNQTATLYITETWIDGPDKLDFQLLEGSAPIQLKGLEKTTAAFRFAPKTPGEKEATFYVKSNSNGVPGTIDSLLLTGESKEGPIMQLAVPDLIIDFGDVQKGSPRIDTLFQSFFRNAGQAALVYVTGLKVIEGEGDVFTASTISNELEPGQSDPLDFSFFVKPEHTLGLKRANFIVISDDSDGTFEVSNDTIYLVGNVVAQSSVPDNIEPDDYFYVTQNPTTGSDVSFYLAPRAGEVGDIFIASLLDLNGREVWRQVGQFRTDAGDVWHVDTKDWPSGVYYVRVSTVGELRARKVSVAR
ncbi:MAG: zinc-dependent metalloprotease [Ignavibacteriae bacterium]|nr:zinc-dependent metalloprotease [Ignavibacteriota bacterium]